MVKIIAIVTTILIAGVLVFAASLPDIFRVQRSVSIKAPPEKVFGLINDFKLWASWSPWEKKDPAMKRTFGAVAAGVGATYAWDGNGDVGQGSMEITDSLASSRIVLRLDFVKPFEGHNTVEFTLQPRGNMTKVTWAMQGPTPYFAKIIHVFINMNNMVGGDFETGLANLKAAVEQ